MGLSPVVIWQVQCDSLQLTTFSDTTPEFWRERWELYRWVYLGGRFLANLGVTDLEIFNEPDIDECMTGPKWEDHYVIRTKAFQDAYRDAGKRLNLIGPPMSSPKVDTTYAGYALKNKKATFPSGSNQDLNIHEFSYHQYNAPGFGMKSAYARMNLEVKAANAGQSMPIRITEHNCYSVRKADSVSGGDVNNLPATAACLAGQVAGILGGPVWTSVFKLTQTLKRGESGIAKNGLLFADNKVLPCDVGGSTKTAEAYRLILRGTPGGKKLWSLGVLPELEKLGYLRMYAVNDAKVRRKVYIWIF